MPKENLDFILSVVFTSFFVLVLMLSGILFFRIYVKRKNKLLLERERMNIQFEQTLMQSKLEIQEQTFQHISQELHDNIGQVLSLVSINLNTLHAPGERAKITMMDELLGRALVDLRNLSHSLDADHIRDNGWMKPVQKLLDYLHRSGKYKVHVSIEEELPALGNERPIILFRMIQEVINNMTRHAAATEIWFSAKEEDRQVKIEIRDNGKGFDTNAASAGAGLRNLQNRARLIRGTIAIDSQPGKGTQTIITIKTNDVD